MEIKPRIGFDNIKFGMYRKEIIEILGEPDQIIEDAYDDGEYILIWNKLKISLTFQSNDRFTFYSSKNRDLKFNGKTFMDLEIEKAKSKVFGELKADWVIEDYETFKTHFYEDIWLTLHCEYGNVSNFELGVPFKNETEFDFPE
ncbi:hypothetical protein ERX46_15610 [Brumimicrobium glaciale]|uniref:Uncharacterized protein n=1 Tax=Brumimicrobium glaciale TaxID=200475 RepID=A0A4Q4KHL2_9FLAO|nr:hypothetical protein [Brumimicrobium glaciale]RYM32107.1 hypothetical protein ERX46_15610 [Brumimicrobium glaciale]